MHVSGDYPDMFRRLFAGHPEVEIVVYDVIGGDMPADPGECDAWITTGSRHSVNDDEPWIRQLEQFVRDVAQADVPFVGVCFGHQLIAKALGGTVVKSDRGWGVGAKEVEVTGRPGSGLLIHRPHFISGSDRGAAPGRRDPWLERALPGVHDRRG